MTKLGTGKIYVDSMLSMFPSWTLYSLCNPQGDVLVLKCYYGTEGVKNVTLVGLMHAEKSNTVDWEIFSSRNSHLLHFCVYIFSLLQHTNEFKHDKILYATKLHGRVAFKSVHLRTWIKSPLRSGRELIGFMYLNKAISSHVYTLKCFKILLFDMEILRVFLSSTWQIFNV